MRTGATVRDITFGAPADREDFLTIPFFAVRDKLLISPVLPEVSDPWELINRNSSFADKDIDNIKKGDL